MGMVSINRNLVADNNSIGENTRKKDKSLYYYQLGDHSRLQGSYKDAINQFTLAIKVNPKFLQAYNSRGNCKVILNDYYGALSDYNKAIKINPKYPLAYKNRGIVYIKLGDSKKAFDNIMIAAKLGDFDAKKMIENIYKDTFGLELSQEKRDSLKNKIKEILK